MLVDYHVHAAAHGEFMYTQEWIALFLDKACQQGIKEIGLSEHDEFSSIVDVQTFLKLQADWEKDIKLRLGVEVDFLPGREQKIHQIIQTCAYDYIIGSVHFIDGWGFDHPDFQDGYAERDIDEIYAQYAGLLLKMLATGFFDIVGHLDLIKIWGHRPKRNSALYYLEPVLRAIKASGLAVEINSGGLRKKVAELYPAHDLVERLFSLSIPITFGSDAHHPDQVGEGLQAAYQSAQNAGYKQFVRFDKRQKIVTPI